MKNMSEGVSSKHTRSYGFFFIIFIFYCMHIKTEHYSSNAGFHFVGSYFSSAMDEKLQSPVGFEIIFPGMLGYAIEMGLDLPISQNDMDFMFHIRDLELKRFVVPLLIFIPGFSSCFPIFPNQSSHDETCIL